MNRKTIVHVKKIYLPVSETFIYRLITNIEGFNNKAIAENGENLTLFPFINLLIPRYNIIARIIDGLVLLVLGRKFFWEMSLEQALVSIYNKPSILHAHFGDTGGVVNYRVARKLNIPFVVSFHGYDASSHLRKKRWIRRYQKMFPYCSKVIVISRNMKQKLVNIGCSENRIEIVHCGINLSEFKFRLRIKQDYLKRIPILMVGRFVEKKGFKYGIMAVKKALSSNPLIELRIIGDGPLKRELKQIVIDADLSQQVVFLGLLSNDVVRKEMDSSLILLVPSVTAKNGDQEGLPYVIPEALASGLLVISTEHSGIPEAIIDGQTGFLVPEKDTAKMALKINYLIENNDKWPRLSNQGRAIIEEQFDIRKESEKLEKIYKNALL